MRVSFGQNSSREIWRLFIDYLYARIIYIDSWRLQRNFNQLSFILNCLSQSHVISDDSCIWYVVSR